MCTTSAILFSSSVVESALGLSLGRPHWAMDLRLSILDVHISRSVNRLERKSNFVCSWKRKLNILSRFLDLVVFTQSTTMFAQPVAM